MLTTKVCLYAEDKIVYSFASSVSQAADELQPASKQLQASLYGLKLILNTKKMYLELTPQSQIMSVFIP